MPRLLFLIAALSGCGVGQSPAPLAHANDNRTPAGSVRGDTLTLALEMRAARWHPESEDSYTLDALVFAEPGKPGQVPGPLIRVRTGTTIHAQVTNTLRDSTLVLHGFHTRPATTDDTLQIPPGTTREVRFPAGAAGTYYYWGSTTGRGIDDRGWPDDQLNGAFIVDSAGAEPEDRVFVIGIWSHFADRIAPGEPDTGEVMVINGKAWPYTEHFQVPVGDSLRWRWVNPSASSHPMHLHGVFYEVASRGDGQADTLYAPGARLSIVTELMLPGGTMSMRWAPARPGNWIFHCHFAFHVSPSVSLERSAAPAAHHRMGGLVLGIEATGGAAAPDAPSPRPLRLVVQERANRIRGGPGYGYVLDRGADPAADSVEIPGSPLVLTRGEPVAITVVNRLKESAAVHWHGIELESYPDGVPDMSGIPPRLFRPIAPGDSFTARFTPPRAGTFIYHSHFNELEQLANGLYGALLVMNPGERYDPATDHVVIVGEQGPSTFPDSVPSLINGAVVPAPLHLAAGRTHRLRLINIDADHRIRFSLRRNSALATWRAIAKDGADLPPALAGDRPATLLTGPGETADFLITPRAGDVIALRIEAPYVDVPWAVTLPITVGKR